MISFYDGQLTDILKAHNLTDDPAVQALSLALREGTRLLYRYAQGVYIYCGIDTASEKVVDLLAAELRTQYYDQGLPLETKRALVRNTLIWYMTAGTPAAVEELVAVVFGEGEVKEWFEYGAEPYWFKIVTNATLTEDAVTYFAEMVRRVKNTRSHIGAIEVHRTVDETVYAGACAFPVYRPPAIIDGYQIGREIDETVYAGGVAAPQYRPAAIVDGFKKQGGEITADIFQGAGEASQTHQAAIFEALSFQGNAIQAEAVKAGAGQASATRQAAIIEGFSQDGAEIDGTIKAFTASNSKYSNTIKTE